MTTSSKTSIDNVFVYPGDLIDIDLCNIRAGEGTYMKNNLLYSSLVGNVSVTEDFASGVKNVCVKSHRVHNNECDAIINVGQSVLCKVVKLQMNQAIMDIIAVVKKYDGDKYNKIDEPEFLELRAVPRGVVRREDIRLSEVDKLVVGECFHIGDIVRATVLSLGDARQYILSTAAAEYGVLWAVNKTNNNIMTPLNWKVSLLACTLL